MILSPPHYDDPQHPSLYDGLTGWASHAHQRLLIGLVAAGIVAAGVILVIDWRRVPISGLLLTVSAVAGWGLLEQRAATPHSALVAATQTILVVLGTIAAVIAGFGLLFWVMGPAPVL
ncbi:MAG TPA: hypothetical protein VIG08_17530 [Gemmatimonadales bacterium]|jgi:hypothetical protein